MIYMMNRCFLIGPGLALHLHLQARPALPRLLQPALQLGKLGHVTALRHGVPHRSKTCSQVPFSMYALLPNAIEGIQDREAASHM